MQKIKHYVINLIINIFVVYEKRFISFTSVVNIYWRYEALHPYHIVS
jgi:hypothetical protein